MSLLQTDIGVTLPSSPTTEKNGNAMPNLIPPSIPTQHPYRTLVVCFDGTGDQYVTHVFTKPVLTILLSSQVRHGRKDIISFDAFWIAGLTYETEFQHCRVLRSVEERWSRPAACVLSGSHERFDWAYCWSWGLHEADNSSDNWLIRPESGLTRYPK
jgi:hypothetical protein